MKTLSSNKDLYDYLLSLALILKQRGLIELSDAVEFASHLVSTIPSTEFLGESRIALKKVWSQRKGVLTRKERSDLRDVLKQLDKALKTN